MIILICYGKDGTMGLDVYAGTLTRYYGRNWKNIVQQWGEANGMKVHIVRPESQNVEIAPPEEIEQGVSGWRDHILDALSEVITEPANWAEDYDTTPYYTDKPDWAAIEALQLYVACLKTGTPVPKTVKKGFTVSDEDVYKQYMETKEEPVSLFDTDNWWLPIKEAFMFQGYLPTGDEMIFATVGLLRQELEEINSFEWQADEQTILDWTNTEGYPDDVYFGKNGLSPIREHEEYDTVSLAKLAFSILWRAVLHSEQYGTLIIFDF